MNDVRAELTEVRYEVAGTLQQTADLIDHWIAGLEAGISKERVIEAMKRTSALLHGLALKP